MIHTPKDLLVLENSFKTLVKTLKELGHSNVEIILDGECLPSSIETALAKDGHWVEGIPGGLGSTLIRFDKGPILRLLDQNGNVLEEQKF